MQIFKNISLINHNTFRVDTIAENLVLIENAGDFEILLKTEEFHNQNKFFLGAGSNLLITHPISGLTIKNLQSQIRIIQENEDFALIEVDSGLEWHKFVTYCLENSYYGLENLALIPGLVGASPVQNIGAYGVEQSNYFHSLECIDLISGKSLELTKNDCKFNYRYSIFKQIEYKNYFITKVRYKLSKRFEPQLSYKDLKLYFEGKTNITAHNIFDAVIEIRNKKLPDYKDYPNAGSFFKNPVITQQQLNNLLSIEPTMVHYPLQDNFYKISAANLIEKAGLKGYRKNNVGISTKHSLIIVNFGNSTGEEIYDFSKFIISVVYDKYKILLEPEVIII